MMHPVIKREQNVNLLTECNKSEGAQQYKFSSHHQTLQGQKKQLTHGGKE